MPRPKALYPTYCSPHFFLTGKQNQLMAVITARNKDGSPVDLDEILERLPYETTKESLQFSLRALEGRKLIRKLEAEKRRGRRRRLVELTEEGKAFMTAGVSLPPALSFVETPAESAAFEATKALQTDVFHDLSF